MVDEWNCEYDPMADIEFITTMYSHVIFTSPSVMYNKAAECARTMTTNGLLTNQFPELNDAPWAVVLLGEYCNEDLAANVALFAIQCHILHVDSLFRTFIGSMNRRASQPRKDACPLFITDPSMVDLGKNLDGNISA